MPSNDLSRTYFDKLAYKRDENQDISDDKLTYLFSKVPFNLGDIVLDVGSGTGVISERIYQKTKSNVIGIDISKEMVSIAICKFKDNNYIKFINEDFLNTRFINVDGIVVFNAYPHFIDLDNFILKSYNSLKKGGYIAILHTNSKEKINSIHTNIEYISRKLNRAQDEVKPFLNYFDLLSYEDNEDLYYFVLSKK